MTDQQKRKVFQRVKSMTTDRGLIGKRFGRLTVVAKDDSHRRKWVCQCDCGEQRSVFDSNLTRGVTVSCGCYNQEMRERPKTHGLSRLPEYGIWNGIKNRCYNPNRKAYPEYGGRGIKMCDSWRDDFETFYTDMGPRPTEKHSIDRIDVNGNYEPGNCRWALDDEQSRNKRFRGNHSGARGVYPNKSGWVARIRVDGELVNLGTYGTIKEASKARREAEIRYWGYNL